MYYSVVLYIGMVFTTIFLNVYDRGWCISTRVTTYEVVSIIIIYNIVKRPLSGRCVILSTLSNVRAERFVQFLELVSPMTSTSVIKLAIVYAIRKNMWLDVISRKKNRT